MKLFEIIFILLLLLPLALVMRYFITKLSAQRPVQRRYASELEEDKPTVSGWMKKRRSRKAEERSLQEEEEQEELREQREFDPSFTPRSPTSLKRTERIPFAQMYGQSGHSTRSSRSGHTKRTGQPEPAAAERERKRENNNRDPGSGRSRKRRKKRRRSARTEKRQHDRRER